MAIGACGRQIATLVLRSTSGATLCGLVFGGVGAVAAGDALRGYLYGVSPLDPIALGAVLALLGVAAVAATLLPLRRAVRTDPAVASEPSERASPKADHTRAKGQRRKARSTVDRRPFTADR